MGLAPGQTTGLHLLGYHLQPLRLSSAATALDFCNLGADNLAVNPPCSTVMALLDFS